MSPAELAPLVTWRVVRVPDPRGGERRSYGTAVVVDGHRISEALVRRALLFTCSHVCSARGEGELPRPLAPHEAAVDFDDGERCAGPRPVRRVVWESHRDELDAALFEVDELPAWSRDAAAELMARPVRTAELDERVVMRGYLMNQPRQLARLAVPVVAVQPPYLHYDLETGRGLSGAPLFSAEEGELLGLHRGDSKVLPKELALASRHGVGFAEILRAARRALATAN
jgi:Trypsin-like peptidase domain